MVAFKLTMNQTEVNRISRAASLKIVTDTTRRTLNRANVLTPVDTGLLRSRNQMRVRQRGQVTTAEIWNDTTYSRAVHDGSKAYTIRPKRKKVLRFEIGGEVIFAKKVRMPARRGRPWLYRALVEVARVEGYTVKKL